MGVLEWVLNEAMYAVPAAANHSHDWHISDVNLVCSTLRLNSSLSEAYAAHVLSGKSLLIPCKTINCMPSDLPDQESRRVSV